MLSFNEIITYEPLVLVFLAFGVILALGGIWFLVNKDKSDIPMGLFATCAGIGILVFVGAVIVNESISTTTITPCNMVFNGGGYCGYVVDITSDEMYQVCDPYIQLKLHVNQTSDVILQNKFLASHPTIVNATGKYCPSGIATACF